MIKFNYRFQLESVGSLLVGILLMTYSSDSRLYGCAGTTNCLSKRFNKNLADRHSHYDNLMFVSGDDDDFIYCLQLQFSRHMSGTLTKLLMSSPTWNFALR